MLIGEACCWGELGAASRSAPRSHGLKTPFCARSATSYQGTRSCLHRNSGLPCGCGASRAVASVSSSSIFEMMLYGIILSAPHGMNFIPLGSVRTSRRVSSLKTMLLSGTKATAVFPLGRSSIEGVKLKNSISLQVYNAKIWSYGGRRKDEKILFL